MSGCSVTNNVEQQLAEPALVSHLLEHTSYGGDTWWSTLHMVETPDGALMSELHHRDNCILVLSSSTTCMNATAINIDLLLFKNYLFK